MVVVLLLMTGGSFKPAIKVVSLHRRDNRLMARHASTVYTTREQIDKHNLDDLVALNIPCARILAKHTVGADPQKASADMVAGLDTVLVLGKEHAS